MKKPTTQVMGPFEVDFCDNRIQLRLNLKYARRRRLWTLEQQCDVTEVLFEFAERYPYRQQEIKNWVPVYALCPLVFMTVAAMEGARRVLGRYQDTSRVDRIFDAALASGADAPTPTIPGLQQNSTRF